MVDSKELNPKKVIALQFDSLAISAAMLAIFLTCGVQLSTANILKSFIPTIAGNQWFITCYIIYYLIHTLLNGAIRSLNESDLLKTCIGLFAVYSVMQSVLVGYLFYTRLMGFICIHFFVAYIKLYMPGVINSRKRNVLVSMLSFGLFITFLLVLNIAGNHIAFLKNKMLYWCQFMNPLIIIWGIAMFSIALNSNIRSNKVINYVSSLSLVILLIHENIHVYNNLRPFIFYLIYHKYGYGNILLWVLLMSIITFVTAGVIGAVYKLVTCKVQKVYSELIFCTGNKIMGVMVNLILKFK